MKTHRSMLPIIAAGGSLVSIVVLIVVAGLISSAISQSSEGQLEFNTFRSCEELAERLSVYPDYYYPYPKWAEESVDAGTPVPPAAGGTDSRNEYSTTNVQVAGIDESDIVKTDGKNIYVIANKVLYIVPATQPDLGLAHASVSLDYYPQGMFVHQDKLVVFGQDSRYSPYPWISSISPDYWPGYRNQLVVSVYSVQQDLSVKLDKNIFADGSFNTARLSDGIVYMVSNHYPEFYEAVNAEEAAANIPHIAEVSGKGRPQDSEYRPMADCNQISFYGNTGNTFTTVISLDLNQAAEPNTKVLVGGADTIYMSRNNLYLTTPEYLQAEGNTQPTQCSFWESVTGQCYQDFTPSTVFREVNSTAIFRMEVDGQNLKFAAAGEVAGRLLNQFSIDEHSGFLRVATTQTSSRGFATNNSMFVLDMDLQEVGAVTGLARDENIYSVRYIGDRAYMVTFRTVDPLFVIDLSVPQQPKVLGELKIPGYSDYLHPYDQNHIIGFGRDANELTGRVGGLKMALFDVRDPANPREVAKEIIGGSGSDSPLLRDHKALLFDREQDLLVIPVILYSDSYIPEFVGFNVYGLNTRDGFSLKKAITATSADNQPLYYYMPEPRSLYIGETLFMWTGESIISYDLTSLQQLGLKRLVESNDWPYYGYDF